MLDATEARRSRLRLGLLMKRIAALHQEILELERNCPAPTLGEFTAMASGMQPYLSKAGALTNAQARLSICQG